MAGKDWRVTWFGKLWGKKKKVGSSKGKQGGEAKDRSWNKHNMMREKEGRRLDITMEHKLT